MAHVVTAVVLLAHVTVVVLMELTHDTGRVSFHILAPGLKWGERNAFLRSGPAGGRRMLDDGERSDVVDRELGKNWQ
jgi:hypothetical protein